MIYVKCNKCKRVAVEVSKEEATREDYLEAAKECSCGNSYNNFTSIIDTSILPQGITLEAILRKDEQL